MTTFELIQAAIFFCTTLKILDDNLISIIYPLMHIGIDSFPENIKNMHLNRIKNEILNKFEKNLIWTDIVPI